MTRVAHCLWHHGNFIWFWFAHLSAYGHLTETIKYLSWLEQSSCCATCHSNRCSLHNLIGTPCVVFHWNYFCLWACSESLWHKLSITLETFEYCELEHLISSHSLLHTHYPAGIITFWPYSQNVAAQTKTGNVSPPISCCPVFSDQFLIIASVSRSCTWFVLLQHACFNLLCIQRAKKLYNLFPIPHTHTDALTMVFNFMFFYFSSLFPLKICWKCFWLHQETLGYLLKW